MNSTVTSTLYLVVFALAACGGEISSQGTSSGETPASYDGPDRNVPGPTVSGGSSGSSSGGISRTVLASLDDACAGNPTLTGRAALAELAAEYRPTFERIGAAGTSPAKLVISYDGGAITCQSGTTGSTGGAPDMPPSIELAVSISLTTDDGALQETMGGALTRRIGAGLDFHGTMPAGAKVGTIALTPMDGFAVSISVGGTIDATKQAATGTVMQQGAKSGVGQVRGLGMLK